MKIIALSSIGLFVLSGHALVAQTPDAARSDNAVVAVVNGAPITLGEFERRKPTALFQARNTFIDAEKKAVDEYIEDVLLEQQAQKEHVTVQQLLAAHVDSKVAKDPDEAALRVYYDGIDTPETFEAIAPKITAHLRERRAAKIRAAYILDLRKQANIAFKLTPPRVEIALDKTPVRGPANAPLTLVEYADYECPYCQQVQPDLDRIEAEYRGKIAFAYKDVPLPMHSHAQKAAEAAHCAGVQNKYWEFHDLVLKTKALEVADLKAGAHALGLNQTTFDSCLDSGVEASLVKSQLDEAQKLGLQGTPSFFLNGRFFSGNMGYDQLRQIIEEELAAVGTPKPAQTASR